MKICLSLILILGSVLSYKQQELKRLKQTLNQILHNSIKNSENMKVGKKK